MGFLYQEKTLSEKVAKGGFWVFVLNISVRFLGFIRLLILARVLNPRDFGLMGIALITIGVLETFFNSGFQAALIQKEKNIEKYLDVTWTALVLRGGIIFSVLYMSAPLVADFFKAPQAEGIVRIVGISVLLQAFTNIGIIYFKKELEFNKEFLYQLGCKLSEFFVTIVLAFTLGSVWALVFGFLAGSFAKCALSYWAHPYRPRFCFNLDKLKELFSYGKWMLSSGILIFLITQGDDALVGKVLGVTMLGFYQMAYLVSNTPATEIGHIISQVSFPLYAKLQQDLERLQKFFLVIVKVTAMFSLPLSGIIFILAPDIIYIFLGQKWMSIVSAIRILCVFGLLRANASTGGPVVLSLGKPKLITIFAFIQLVILAAIIYPLTVRYNIEGTSVAVAVAFIAIFIPGIFVICRLINLKFLTWLKSLVASFLAALVMTVCVYLAKTHIFLNRIALTNLILLLLLGVLIYVPLIFLLEVRFIKKLKAIFNEMKANALDKK